MKLQFKRFFKQTWSKLANDLKDNRKSILNILFISLLMGCACFSAFSFSMFTKDNRQNTLEHILEKYEETEKEEPNCIIFPQNLVFERTTYHIPGWSEELRSIFYKNECFDLYQSNWQGKYTPGIVNYINKENVPISFLLWPKDDYIKKEWKYNMPLIVDFREKGISDPNDLIINKEYARWLLQNDFGNTNDNFELLKDYEACINYAWKYQSSSAQVAYTPLKYKIKGIMDSDSQEYLYYQNKFGDFFLTNEYFSLPFVNQTYIRLDSTKSENIKIFKIILSIYDYEFTVWNFENYGKSKLFQYQITFFGNYDSEKLSIRNIGVNPSIYNIQTSKLFEYYSTPIYLMYCIISIAFNISFLLFTIILCRRLKKEIKSNNTNEIFIKIILVTFILLSFLFSLLLLKICSLFIDPFIYLSHSNTLGFIISALEMVLVYLSVFIKQKQTEEVK